MSASKRAIHWFRQDLRLADNPSLTQAVKHGQVVPIYILDDAAAGMHAPGAASRWWLHHSLTDLRQRLNGALSVYKGDSVAILVDLVTRLQITAVHWTREYVPWRVAQDVHVANALRERGVAVSVHSGSLLWEPDTIAKPDGTRYGVFTPFYKRGCLEAPAPRRPIPEPQGGVYQADSLALPSINALNLLPHSRWDLSLAPHWDIGELGAHRRFNMFVDTRVDQYKDRRDFPAESSVSRLSPHLHFGEVSPNQLWHAVYAASMNNQRAHFCTELGWREFAYYMVHHHPTLPHAHLQAKFNAFPWQEDPVVLDLWQRGETGIPMVDAGMRELWQTGYMHNRPRMIAGSFLVKNARMHWRHGERWFWDTLVDANPANNSASWQWVAGSGSDAAPYFRVFNPVLQGQKFDPDGDYIRRYIPELAALPTEYLAHPWTAPASVLASAGIQLGITYPEPCLDLEKTRASALAAFQRMNVESV